MTSAPRAVFPPAGGLSNAEVRLLGYLFSKRLLGEEVTDPVLLQRLVDMTKSVQETRADIPRRTDVRPDAHAQGGDVGYSHHVVNELLDDAVQEGTAHVVAGAAAGAVVGAAACDRLGDALLVKQSGRLAPGEIVRKVCSADPRLKHVFGLLESSAADGRPRVLGDPLLGGPGRPEFACLESDARFGGVPRTPMAWAGYGSGTALQSAYADTRTRLAQRHGRDIPGRIAHVRQHYQLNPDKLWPSLPVVHDDYAERAGRAVCNWIETDSRGLMSHATDFCRHLLQCEPPALLVRQVVEAAASLGRVE